MTKKKSKPSDPETESAPAEGTVRLLALNNFVLFGKRKRSVQRGDRLTLPEAQAASLLNAELVEIADD